MVNSQLSRVNESKRKSVITANYITKRKST
ncbi:hypothetical protein NIES22_46420 [Calothrix brevissima NIES-22]|nr:hypothetical protein NIES22_46420 [Calothrix brevissima NIES-22]